MTYELPQAAINFINFLKVNDMSDNTTSGYIQELHDFFEFLIDHKKLNCSISNISEGIISKINIKDLNAFILNLSEKTNKRGNRYSTATKSKYISCIKSFFKYVTDELELNTGDITSKLKYPKKSKTIAKHLEIDNISNLLNSIDNERNYAIMVLFLNCGLRLSELIDLEISNIISDKYGNKIIVNGKGKVERTLYLNDICMSAINKYLSVRQKCDIKNLFISEYIKGECTPMKSDGTRKMVKKYLSGIGIDASPHSLRHTFASLAISNGVDIKTLQEALGHSDIKTTDRYIHSFGGNTSKIAQLVSVG